MSSTPLNVAVIVGSTREGRQAPVVADWIVDEIASQPGFKVDVIDLADTTLPAAYPAHLDEQTAAFQARLDGADAYVVVTPEYNHSYPAALKHAVDLGRDEWRRKPVAFVSYGGVSGGLRAVEHLRGVFAELHAMTIRESVSFHGPWNGFRDGRPSDPVSAHQAAAVMLDDLAWWGRALREARKVELEEARW